MSTLCITSLLEHCQCFPHEDVPDIPRNILPRAVFPNTHPREHCSAESILDPGPWLIYWWSGCLLSSVQKTRTARNVGTLTTYENGCTHGLPHNTCTKSVLQMCCTTCCVISSHFFRIVEKTKYGPRHPNNVQNSIIHKLRPGLVFQKI